MFDYRDNNQLSDNDPSIHQLIGDWSTDQQLLEYFDDSSIKTMCQVSHYIYGLCNNDFWTNRLYNRFNKLAVIKNPYSTSKQWYLELSHYLFEDKLNLQSLNLMAIEDNELAIDYLYSSKIGSNEEYVTTIFQIYKMFELNSNRAMHWLVEQPKLVELLLKSNNAKMLTLKRAIEKSDLNTIIGLINQSYFRMTVEILTLIFKLKKESIVNELFNQEIVSTLDIWEALFFLGKYELTKEYLLPDQSPPQEIEITVAINLDLPGLKCIVELGITLTEEGMMEILVIDIGDLEEEKVLIEEVIQMLDLYYEQGVRLKVSSHQIELTEIHDWASQHKLLK